MHHPLCVTHRLETDDAMRTWWVHELAPQGATRLATIRTLEHEVRTLRTVLAKNGAIGATKLA